ncbi:MAG: hypothetical protein OXM62_09950 [bacterium]|nr:hypothetical protein [bacterium]MDE0235318.1 hypothetical protein [bacterium]
MNLLQIAVQDIPFPQIVVHSETTFNSFLAKRGFRLFPNGLKNLEVNGVIRPIADTPRRFHPFQIWPISEYLKNMQLDLTSAYSTVGDDTSKLRQIGPINWNHGVDTMATYSSTDFCIAFQEKLLPLLLWIESYYLPVVRGFRPSFVTLTNCDIVDWQQWRLLTNPQRLLKSHCVSIEDVIDWRERLLFSAYRSDPCPDLYMLLRSLSREHRRRFSGDLRLAYDLYEIAELMRLFIADVTDTPVRKEWDPRGGPDSLWVRNVYGSQPRFGDPAFLKKLTRHFGLDPAFRVMWLVEGDTEEAFITQYSERLGMDMSGFVTIHNFGGDSTMRNRVPAVDASLETARHEQCFVTLTFDDSSDLRSRVESLMQSKLVNVPFVLNEPDFELGNFTIDYLVDVVIKWAADVNKPIELDRATLIERVESRIVRKGLNFDKAINDILHICGESFALGKGAKWGRRLADQLIERIEAEADSDERRDEDLSSIEQQIRQVHWSSQPFINYPLTIQEIDPDELEIGRRQPSDK